MVRSEAMVDLCTRPPFVRVVYLMVGLLEDVEGVEVEFAGVEARALSRGAEAVHAV
ncbi:MAG: hypothetical protein QXR17_08370 [Candidatus Bathyarchaeia archaeon]